MLLAFEHFRRDYCLDTDFIDAVIEFCYGIGWVESDLIIFFGNIKSNLNNDFYTQIKPARAIAIMLMYQNSKFGALKLVLIYCGSL